MNVDKRMMGKFIQPTLFDSVFSRFKWYRKRRGGKWEIWVLDNFVTGNLFDYCRVNYFSDNEPPYGGRSTPTRESYK